MQHFKEVVADVVLTVVIMALLLMAMIMLNGCASLPVTGPLTAVSAGVAPEDVVELQTVGSDGEMRVQPTLVKKDAGAGHTMFHYILMAGEMWGYYELGRHLLDDGGSQDETIVSSGRIHVKGDADIDGKADTLGQDIIIEGDLKLRGSINTGPLYEGE